MPSKRPFVKAGGGGVAVTPESLSAQAGTRMTYLNLGTPTANTTNAPSPRFGVPVGHTGVRVQGIHVSADAVFADADGTLVLNAIVNDVSEGADDTIVSSEDIETLVTAANQFFECSLASETSEDERTMAAGDTLRCTLVSDSAAIDTNADFVVCVEWIPLEDTGPTAERLDGTSYLAG